MPPSNYAFEQLEPSAPLPRDTHERVLAQAGAEAERIREHARTEGYEQGLAQGHADGLAAIAQASSALGEALSGLQLMREQLADAVERDSVELALALAAKLLSGALEVEPERVLDTIRGALRRIGERRSITVLVAPEDLEIVSGAIGELQARAGGIERCEVQADRRVGRGGAIVRTSEGEIDARIETQLQRAREVALAGLQNEESAV